MKTVLLLTASLCTALLLPGCKPKQAAPTQIPAMPVKVTTVTTRDEVVFTEFVGQTFAAQSVDVTARVEGTLASIDFKDGARIKAGDLLFTIDDKQFLAAVSQARGAVAQAQVASDTAKRDLERLSAIYEKGGVSAQDLDAAVLKSSSAAANLVSTKAALETAELQLGYTRITAPISGQISNSTVSVGNLVGRGQATLLTNIVGADPIHVRFSVDEKFYLETIKHTHKGAVPKGIFELILADGMTHDHKGDLVFVDNRVDPKTGTLLVEVAFPNPDYTLRPGLFGRVRFPRQLVKDAIIIPQRAVQELQATYSVIVITADNKAEFRPIKVGARQGSGWIVTAGLKPGDKVLVEGSQKLRPGSPVMILPDAAPAK